MSKDNLVIAVDFDGTCVTHNYPEVGQSIGAQHVLRKIVDNGHRLILLTMRSGKELEDAISWFSDNHIPLWKVNHNPEQNAWSGSEKIYADLYIDDAALGCPLIYLEELPVKPHRPHVDWYHVELILKEQGVI